MPTRILLIIGAAWCALTALAATASAQSVGDANCDGVVNAADMPELIVRLFTDVADGCFGADANDDGVLSAADLTALQVWLTPPAPTPTPAPGPRLTFFGLAAADGQLVSSLGEIEPGLPVYFRAVGTGFKIVVEGAPQVGGAPLAFGVYDSDPQNPVHRPDLQIESDRPLGDGTPAVCDDHGVPGIDPSDFSITQPISDALNDFACHFDLATRSGAACTQDAFGMTAFASGSSRGQFCLQVTAGMLFPDGDTTLTVQLRDLAGKLGAPTRLIVRVGGVPDTFTPTPTPTPVTPKPTRTPSFTRTPTASVTPTLAATLTRTASPTPTRTNSPVMTPTPTVTGPRPATATPTVTPTVTWTPTRTNSPTRTPSFTPSPTPTVTFTATSTATSTPTPSATSSPSPTPLQGPIVSFFGVTSASGVLQTPIVVEDGVPVYLFPGVNAQIVVEGAIGPSGKALGLSTYTPVDRPDLQIMPSNPLGDGSPAVCDSSPPTVGGVPGVNPPRFDDDQTISDVMNDLGCRFDNGAGAPKARACSDGCVQLGDSGELGCVGAASLQQFCASLSSKLLPPPGDTLFLVRLRDKAGNVGQAASIIVRVTQ